MRADREIKMPDAQTQEYSSFDGYKIQGLIAEIAEENRIKFESCLDVGCGLKPAITWFRSLAGANAVHTCTESDPEMVGTLLQRGVDVVDPFNTDRDLTRDLVLAKEVAEHITREDSPDFFRFCAKNSRKMFAMTTPNFEYWLRKKPNDKEMKFMPSHMLHFDPASKNPHNHKQIMTPQSVHNYLTNAFDRSWEIRVYRAWPWKIRDIARGKEWNLHFKIFAMAWKQSERADQ